MAAANYPFFYPVITHDIAKEIPAPLQGFCWKFYRSWQFGLVIGLLADLVFNLILFSTVPFTNAPILFLTHIGHALLLPLACFLLHYWPLYKALKSNNVLAWAVFCIAHLFFMGWILFIFIGFWDISTNWTTLKYLLDYDYPKVTLFAYAADKAFYGLLFIWYLYLTFLAVRVLRYDSAAAHDAKNQQGNEMNDVSKSAPNRPTWAINAGGQDVNVSVDPKVAASVASKAVTSGAAAQLAKGTKPKMGKDGKMTFEVDPEAAKQAAGTMYKSGAAQELAAGTSVSSNGYSIGSASGKQYKVIQEFTAAEQGDLSLKLGDRVTITRTVDANWVEGTLNGKTGIFPRKYVAEL